MASSLTPKEQVQSIIKELELKKERGDEDVFVEGIWTPKVRRLLKEQGLLVYRFSETTTDITGKFTGYAKHWTVAYEYPALVGIESQPSKKIIDHKLPVVVLEFYLDQGWMISQRMHYREGGSQMQHTGEYQLTITSLDERQTSKYRPLY